jgi:hypothetical protein
LDAGRAPKMRFGGDLYLGIGQWLFTHASTSKIELTPRQIYCPVVSDK